jgi:TPR repeat protein
VGAAAIVAALLASGCASNPPAAHSGPPRAAQFALGMELRPVSRETRKKLKLAAGSPGAEIVAVLAGGPAAVSGLRPGEVVERIGETSPATACELVDGPWNRVDGPVRVTLRGARGSRVDKTVVPVEQAPLLEKSCREGESAGCYRLGRVLPGGDRSRAAELEDSACRSGFAEACSEQGLRLALSDGGDRAAPLLSRACELGSGTGCEHLGFVYANGKGVARDERRATKDYLRSCDLGDARGCYNAGLMSDEGRGTPRDHARAAVFYEESCSLGSTTGCTNLGFLYENGRGVGRDLARSAALYQRGCDGTRCQPSNLTGCVNVGRAYRDGIGLAKDEARAASIFQEACDREPDSDDVGAEGNRSRACSLLGALYLAGDGIPKNVGRGRELSELGCERGDSFGCFNAAAVYTSGSGVDKDPAKSAEFLDRACGLGDAEGCFDLGIAYEKGNGVAADRRRAGELFRKACTLGFKQACGRKS